MAKSLKNILISTALLLSANGAYFTASSFIAEDVAKNMGKNNMCPTILGAIVALAIIFTAYIFLSVKIVKKGYKSNVMVFSHITVVFWTAFSLSLFDYSRAFRYYNLSTTVVLAGIVIVPLSGLILLGHSICRRIKHRQ